MVQPATKERKGNKKNKHETASSRSREAGRRAPPGRLRNLSHHEGEEGGRPAAEQILLPWGILPWGNGGLGESGRGVGGEWEEDGA